VVWRVEVSLDLSRLAKFLIDFCRPPPIIAIANERTSVAAIELYNKTKYPDQPLIDIAKFAKRVMRVKGDVAVVVRYHASSSKFTGLATNRYPYFKDVVPPIKKFADRKYMVKRSQYLGEDYDPGIEDKKVAMATQDGAPGYILCRVPRPSSARSARWTKEDAIEALYVFIHEMRHVYQYRNKEEVLKASGCATWMIFSGYSPYARRRKAHQKRPIEQDVNKALRESNYKKHPRYNEMISKLMDIFSNDEYKPKTVKKTFNKYGEKVSDYRNVKMKTLRNGDKVVRCACGEKAVILDDDQHPDRPIYTHIAAFSEDVMREAVRGGYLSPSDARYTQFGHIVEDGEVKGTLEFGYRVSEPTDNPFVILNWNPYGYRSRRYR
jgi:hypothetical protein